MFSEVTSQGNLDDITSIYSRTFILEPDLTKIEEARPDHVLLTTMYVAKSDTCLRQLKFKYVASTSLMFSIHLSM